MTCSLDPVHDATRIALRDGSEVLVRPIRPEDKEALAREFQGLSDETRYQRFLAGIATLTDSQLRYLTEVDHVDHEAWIALDPTAAVPTILGVARYVRLAESPRIAEVAIVVVDAYQGRGLGSALLALVNRSAARQGIETFRAWTFASNARMVRILRDLGAVVHEVEGPVLCLDVPVYAATDRLPDTPTGRAFKAIAAAGVPRAPVAAASG